MKLTEQVINICSLNKTYQSAAEQVHALSDINLTLSSGVLAAIVGPSGSGKSTLLNILGCMDRPDSGQYILAGNRVSDLDQTSQALIRRRFIGFVFQGFNLIPTISILDNVCLPLMYDGLAKNYRHAQGIKALQLVGLEKFSHRKPKELSGGQQQRVAIARAIVHEPSLLLADEPTGNLDSHTRDDIFDLFKALNKKGTTVVIVTHDNQISAEASQLFTLFDGRLQETI